MSKTKANGPEETGADRRKHYITIPQEENDRDRERSECQTDTDSPQELLKASVLHYSCDQ